MDSSIFNTKCASGLSIQSDVNYFFNSECTELEETDDEFADTDDTMIESIEKNMEDNMKEYSQSLMESVSIDNNCKDKTFQEIFQDYEMRGDRVIPSRSIVRDPKGPLLLQGKDDNSELSSNSDSFWDLMDELYSDELDLEVNEIYFDTDHIPIDDRVETVEGGRDDGQSKINHIEYLSNESGDHPNADGEKTTDYSQIFSLIEENFICKRSEYQLINDRLESTMKLWDRLSKLWSTKIFKEDSLKVHLLKDKFVLPRNKMKQIQNHRKYRTDSLIQRPIYHRTALNNFLQLVCPNCSRKLFGSSLGFLNHCRMVHELKFLTIDDAANKCGLPVSDSVVPEGDPCRYEITLDYFVAQQKLKKDAHDSLPTLHEQRNPFLSPSNEMTRFYIKKKIIVGNTYKPILNQYGELDTYAWILYVRRIKDDIPIENYIKKVRFFLHSSFPKNIVEVHNPPFQIQRQSLKPYPVRVQIHLHDNRNKPISVIHYMTFYSSIVDFMGDENTVEISIDRLYTNGMNLNELQDPNKSKVQVAFDTQKSNQDSLSFSPDFYEPNKNPGKGFESKNINDLIRRIVSDQFPLVSSNPLVKKNGYSYAESLETWYSWSHGKRKASEWQRAHKIQQMLAQDYKIFIKTREVINFCQKLKLTPPSPSLPHVSDPLDEPSSYEYMYLLPILRSRLEKLEFVEAKSLPKKIYFCRFCGCTHLPIYKFNELEQECGEKKLRILNNLHCTYKKYSEQSALWHGQSILDMVQNRMRLIQQGKGNILFSGETSQLSSNGPHVQEGMSADSTFSSTFKPHVKNELHNDLNEMDLKHALTSNFCEIFFTCQNNIGRSVPPTGSDKCIASEENHLNASVECPSTNDDSINTPSKQHKNFNSKFCNELIFSNEAGFDGANSEDLSFLGMFPSPDASTTRISLCEVQKLISQLKDTQFHGIETTAYTFPEITTYDGITATDFKVKKKRGRPVKRINLVANGFKNEGHPSSTPSTAIFNETQNQFKNSLSQLNSAECPPPVNRFKLDENHHFECRTPEKFDKYESIYDSSPSTPSTPNAPHLNFEFKKFELNTINWKTSESLRKELKEILIFTKIDEQAEIALMKALYCFVKKIFFDTTAVYCRERASDPPIESKCKVVVPLHVIQAILNHPNRYNFLTEFGLAKENPANISDEDPETVH